MTTLDRRAAWILVAALGLVALIGFGQGLKRALDAPRPAQVSAGVDPVRDPVPNASPLSTGPVLDEARVRQIAREEAGVLIAPRRKAAVAAAPEPDSADAAAPMTTTPAPPSTGPATPSTPPSPTPAAPPGL